MRQPGREEVEKIVELGEHEELSKQDVWDHYVVEEFKCRECGSDMIIRQWPKSHDANIQCLNPECSNGAGLR